MRYLARGSAVLAACCLLAGTLSGAAQAVVDPVQLITADAETVPVAHTGDSADDPAIWVNAADPGAALLIGDDKLGALETYNLDGTRRQRITTTTAAWGNVDVAQDVTIGGISLDVVAAYNGGLRLYAVNAATRMLEPITDGTGTITTNNGGGLCLYNSPVTHDLSAFSIAPGGRVQQFQISDQDGDGLLDATVVRAFAVGSAAEGCVADDVTGALYIAQQDVALWRYGAEPTAGSTRTAIDRVQPDGHLSADIEGVTLVKQADGSGYLIASAQNQADPNHSYFVAYDRQTNSYLKSFRIVAGTTADGCERTDGVAAYAGDLRPGFPTGVFVCQDNSNKAPGVGNQDFKLVRLDRVVDLSGGDVPPAELSFVGAASANANKAKQSVRIPAAVHAGDALVLFFAQNSSTAGVTGPPGWTLLQQVDVNGDTGRVWERVATATDAGSTVTVTAAQTVKADVTVAAYRGTAAASVDASAAAIDASTRTVHVTPTVSVTQPGSWLVSYWAAKSSAATTWTLPGGQMQRGTTAGTGSGRITAVVSDSNEAIQPGSAGGLGAISSVSSRAVMFTVAVSAH